MVIAELFARALDLREPWVVRQVTLDQDAGAMVIEIDFERGARFAVLGEKGRHGG
jgi:hypothetical protein